MTNEEGTPQPELTEEEQRIREYLVSQAAKRDWIELWPRAIYERGALFQAIEGVTDEQAAWSPGGDEWSIRQIVEHVLTSSRSTLQLIDDLAAGRRKEDREVRPEAKMPSSFDRLRMHLAEHSVRYASLPERLPPMPNLEMTAPHRNFGELNARAWFLFNRIHDTDHRKQIEAVKAAPGYPGGEATSA
jgi:uncharacterized damage-inducible protein DinB